MKTEAAERRTDEEPKRAGGLNARVVYHAVVRHPVVLFLVLVLAGAAAAGVWLFLPLPKKTAAVVYHIASQPQSLLGAAQNQADFNAYKQSQMALIKSRAKTILAALKQPGVSDLQMVKNARPDIYAWLEKYLTVDSKPQSEYVRVTLEGEDEEELLTLLKALDKAYQTAAADRDNGARNTLRDNLEASLKKARAELAQHQDKINQIAGGLGARDEVALTVIASDLRADLSQENRRTRMLEEDLELAQSQLEAAKKAAARKAAPALTGAWVEVLPRPDAPRPFVLQSALDDALAKDTNFQSLEATVRQARRLLAEILGSFQEEGAAEKHPSVINARTALKTAEENRDKYREDFLKRVEAELQERALRFDESRLPAAQAECERIKSQRDRGRKRVQDIINDIDRHNKSKTDLDGVKAEMAVKEKVAAALAGQAEQLRVEAQPQPRVTVADEPYLVTGLEGNRRLKFALLAALGLFGAGFGGLVFWEARSRRVTYPEEVAGGVGARLLGTIPPLAAGHGPPGEADGHTQLIEAIDTARVMITHGTPGGHDLRVLLVTSAVAGEGKTTLSGHLAISLARAGFRTLLVDGDMHAPSAHSLFGVAAAPGLCELLRGEAETAAAVRSSPIPGLSVLPAGLWTVATRQALVGDRWRSLSRELKAGFDFVVVDASPLLLVSDAMLLAREADGVVLSVLLGVSQIARVQETVERLRAVEAELAGVVVNNVRTDVYRRYTERIRPLPVPKAGDESARNPAGAET